MLALVVLTACRSTDPGPEPLPEAQGKLLVYYSGNYPDSTGLVIRDVASGRDTMIVKQAPGAPVYVGGIASAIPSRRSVVGLPSNGSAVREISLVDGVIAILFTPPSGKRVTQISVDHSGQRLAVMLGGPPQLLVVDLTTMHQTTWWDGRTGDFASAPEFDQVTGGIIVGMNRPDSGTESGLYLVRSPGAAPELLVPSSAGVFDRCDRRTAPDGAIVYRGHDRELKMYRPPWAAAGPSVPPGILAYCPVFSPDGKFLLYGISGVGEFAIYRMQDGRITPLPAIWSGHLGSAYNWWYD